MKRARHWTRTLASYLTFLLLAAAAGATSFVRLPDAALVDQATIIVHAVVQPLVRPPVTVGLASTHYSALVLEALRGAEVGEELEFQVPGGIKADGTEEILFGAPSFRPGTEALLFLERDAHGHLRILHFHQGVFYLVPANGTRIAWRNFEQTHEIPAPETQLESEGPRDLARFEAWVADRAAGIVRPADYFLEPEAQEGLEQIVRRYNLLRDGADRPLRWPDFTAGSQVSYFAHQTPQPGLPSGGADELQSALAAWTDDGGSNIRLRYGGLTSSQAGFTYDDGINAVLFDDVGSTAPFGTPFDCETQKGILAFGLARSAGIHTYGGREFRTIVGGDIVFNKNLTCWNRWSSATASEVMTHEVGHTIGLAHSCEREGSPCDSNDKNEAAMRWAAHADGRGAHLGVDDQRAVGYLYGPPDTPSYLSARLRANNEVDLSWDDRADTELRYRLYRGREGQSLSEIAELAANSRGYTDIDTERATTYRYAIRTENEAGLSASVETAITTRALNEPEQLRVTAASAEELTLSWVDKADDETGFEVWGHLFGNDELLLSLPADTTTATLEGLIADSTYSVKVRGIGTALGDTAFSDSIAAQTLLAPIAPCAATADDLCLQQDRFQVALRWKNSAGEKGQGQVAMAGSADSGIFYFFSENNWEMLVKVLNGCAINQHHWVFAAATTDVETTLIVTDTQTGKTAVYFNPLGNAASAITDVEAFEGCETSSSSAMAAPPATASAIAQADPRLGAQCEDNADALCLLGGRFEVSVTWTDFGGQSGSAKAVPFATADSGLLYFFSENNWEMLVKVLDGCALNERVWVFAAATTNVAYKLEVKDRVSGLSKIYENPLGQASAAITDTSAFSACFD